MPKSKKKSSEFSQGRRLYHGTSERFAKLIPINGLAPHPTNPEEKAFSDTRLNINYLSDVYGGYMAHCSSDVDERWGIIELNAEAFKDKLVADSLLNEKRTKRQVSSNKNWEQSLSEVGLCIYMGTIPSDAVRRISIYNPLSNWFITREVLYTTFGKEPHAINQHKYKMLTKWLMGEFLTLEDWLGDTPTSAHTEKERHEIQSALYDRSGLDIFYHGDN